MMNAPYSLLSIVFLCLFFYLLTLLLSRQHIIDKKTHRKIWNSVLLITFLVTGLLGILLVVKINYKLEFALLEKILAWHVEFGIAMVVAAFFHLSWHLNYYLKIFQPGRKKNSPGLSIFFQPGIEQKTGARLFKYPVFLMGFTTLVTQVILLREFLSVFSGNELVIGIILANWMLLTALGAYLGRNAQRVQNPLQFIYGSLILAGILPFITAFLINYLKNILFPVGSMVGIAQVIFTSFLLLLPFCLLSGFLFSFFSSGFSRIMSDNKIREVYAYEAIGSIAGGILFNFALIFFFNTFESLALVLLMHFLLSAYVAYYYLGRKRAYITAALAFLLFVPVLVLKVNIWIKGFLYPNQEMVLSKDTPYGNISITRKLEQYNFYINHVLLADTRDVAIKEEAVHYAMAQHPRPDKVLVLSGGITGVVGEAMKYDVKQLDYLEMNPWVIHYGKKYFDQFTGQNVHVIRKDPRLYTRQTRERYDVILMNMPPPSTLQLNRFYTLEFIQQMEKILRPGGLVCMALPSTVNYVSQAAAELNSILYRTLHQVFGQVQLIAGKKNYFLAGNRPLSLEITRLVEEKGIETEYVNKFYLDDESIRFKSRQIMESLETDVPLNKDFKPITYQRMIQYWLSLFPGKTWILGLVAGLALVLLLFRLKPLPLGMFTGGFTSASLELIILSIFQIIFGNVYYLTGIIITIFMLGLATGSFFSDRLFKEVNPFRFVVLQLALGLFTAMVPLFMFLLKEDFSGAVFLYIIFFLITLVLGFLTGIMFAFVTRMGKGPYARISGEYYSLDLLGSAAGALLVTIVLIPALGMLQVGLLLGLLNLLAGFYTFSKSKSLYG